MSEAVQQTVDNFGNEDEINARREARRRKILDNAKTRLEKLNGRVNVETRNGDMKISKEIYPDPETESFKDLPLYQNTTNFETQDILLNNFREQQDFFSELLNSYSQIPPPNGRFDNDSPILQNPPKATQLSKILKTKIHLAFISLITYILFSIGHESLISYSVFFPLLLWELIEYFLLKRSPTQETSLVSLVLLVSGMSPARSNALMKTLGTLNKIFKDVGVFVFFFVLYHIFATNILYKEGSYIAVSKDSLIHSDEF